MRQSLRTFINVALGIAATTCMLSACTKEQTLGVKEMNQWIIDPANGLLHADERNEDISTIVYYRPVELIVAQEVGGMGYTVAQTDSVRKSYDSLDYFVLKVSKNKQEVENAFAGDPEQFARIVSYLNGDISKDISLKIGNNLMSPEYVSYIRGFGASNATAVIVVFATAVRRQQNDVEFIWQDTNLNSGYHSFQFDINALKSIPALKQ
jgi:hypothetical protein